jgi:hypothetical protein
MLADGLGVWYDLKPLCNKMGYIWTDNANNRTYEWNVCGSSSRECIPTYPVEYQRGVAIQFFGDPAVPGQMCTSKAGAQVQCTRNCEVLAIGVPFITLIDPTNPFGGLNVTHRGVPSLPGDQYQCPLDPLVRCHAV